VSTAREATGGDGAGLLAPPEAVFAPVRSQTAFEETVDRLGTAIKLGLLPPGSQLPAERELCARLGIARSTLRQALTALSQSGHVFATRGRGGGTFVADPQPPADPPSKRVLAEWRDICDERLAVEMGVAVLAAQRAAEPALAALDEVCGALEDPPEVLSSSNGQHRRLLAAVREGDSMRAAQVMSEHLQGTEHVLAGLLPGG
jgi:GntR family transcriptional repressor for pyruvate dehydrogenase complex